MFLKCFKIKYNFTLQNFIFNSTLIDISLRFFMKFYSNVWVKKKKNTYPDQTKYYKRKMYLGDGLDNVLNSSHPHQERFSVISTVCACVHAGAGACLCVCVCVCVWVCMRACACACVCVWGEGRVGVECWCFSNKAEVSSWDSTPLSTFSSAEWKVPGPFSSANLCVWRRCCLTVLQTLTSIEKAQHQSLRALTLRSRGKMGNHDVISIAWEQNHNYSCIRLYRFRPPVSFINFFEG